MINLHGIVVLDNASIVQFLVDLILSQRMFNIVILHLVTPTVVEVVDLAGDFAAIFQVKRLVNLWEATLT